MRIKITDIFPIVGKSEKDIKVGKSHWFGRKSVRVKDKNDQFLNLNKSSLINYLKTTEEGNGLKKGFLGINCSSNTKVKNAFNALMDKLKNENEMMIEPSVKVETTNLQDFIQEFEFEILPLYKEHELHFDKAQIHGRLHATRAVLFAEVMGRYLESKGQKVDFNLLRRTTGLHDAGREANGEDLWEEKSANILKEHLIKKGMSKKEAEVKSRAIIKGSEYKPSLESLLFFSADCMDIMRPCTGRGGRKGFDQSYLLFLKGAKSGTQDALFRERLIEEAWLFIQETEGMKKSLANMGNSGYTERILDVIRQNKEKYPLMSVLI